MEQYTLVFMPDTKGIALVKEMKLTLEKSIGWFNSKNALAHITLCGFKASTEDLSAIEKSVKTSCSAIIPIEVHFDYFDSFPASKAFFIAPSRASKEKLVPIMKLINEQVTIDLLFESNEPHISIARNLDKDKVATARILFQEINLHFLCDAVYLRRFNPKIGQYEVIDKFEFGG